MKNVPREAVSRLSLTRAPPRVARSLARSSPLRYPAAPQSETDGSSFPNGGLRITHRAAAFMSWDKTSAPCVALAAVVLSLAAVVVALSLRLSRSASALAVVGR